MPNRLVDSSDEDDDSDEDEEVDAVQRILQEIGEVSSYQQPSSKAVVDFDHIEAQV